MEGPGRITVVIADDHPVYREAIGQALEARPEYDVAGLFSDGQQALDGICALAPAVAILDAHLPRLSGIEVLQGLRVRALRTRVLILTASDSGGLVYDAMNAGASGFLTKAATLPEICEAVDVVASGGTVLGADAQHRLVADLRLRDEPTGQALTAREQQVLELTAAGLTAGQVAERLGVAPSTVKTHVKAVFAKLEVNDRASAVAVGMRRGLLR